MGPHKRAFNLMGVVTVGERGQVVIPTEARNELKIRAGDKLVVFSGPHRGTLVVATTETFDRMTEHLLGKSRDLAQTVRDLRKSVRDSDHA